MDETAKDPAVQHGYYECHAPIKSYVRDTCASSSAKDPAVHHGHYECHAPVKSYLRDTCASSSVSTASPREQYSDSGESAGSPGSGQRLASL